MGEVVRPGAGREEIRRDVADTVRNADRKGGAVAGEAHAWLDPVVARAVAAESADATATAAVDEAYAQVLTLDDRADSVIKRIRDELWNAIGRARDAAVMKDVFPGGVQTYTDTNVRVQPLLMQVLEGRIAAIDHPAVAPAMRDGWVAAVRAAREPYATAVEALRAAEALDAVTSRTNADAVRALAVALAKLKRAYLNLGLTEAQIHEIIPDAKRRAPTTPAEPPAPAV
jgi:hypothetical protein